MTQKYPPAPILLVDDEELILLSLETILWSHGLNNTICCSDSVKALELTREIDLELVLLDLIMPNISGEEFLVKHLAESPHVPVIIVTGLDEVDNAVQCMRTGAFDYLVKPLDENRLMATINRALEISRLRRQNELLRKKVLSDDLEHPECFKSIVTASRSMFSIFQYCEAISAGREPVLITGETGVGKELISRALHSLGKEQEPFVALNVAGLDSFMFSDTLFGHVRGAYTGANVSRPGLAEKAGHGTLFLDEIGDLSEASQVKLLRLLQEREYRSLGSDSTKTLHARVVTSTHRDLDAKPDSIRRDLYYRLRTHHIRIPPLRERTEDIPVLVDYFLEQACSEFGRPKPEVHPDVISMLSDYNFPGNVRELRAQVFDALGSCQKDILSPENFRKLLKTPARSSTREIPNSTGWTPPFNRLPTLKEASTALVLEAVRRSGNNLSKAAAMLGVSRQALSKRLKNIYS